MVDTLLHLEYHSRTLSAPDPKMIPRISRYIVILHYGKEKVQLLLRETVNLQLVVLRMEFLGTR